MDSTPEEIRSESCASRNVNVPLLHSVDVFLDCRYVAVAARAYAVAGAINVLLNCAVVAAFSCWIDDVTSLSRWSFSSSSPCVEIDTGCQSLSHANASEPDSEESRSFIFSNWDPYKKLLHMLCKHNVGQNTILNKESIEDNSSVHDCLNITICKCRYTQELPVWNGIRVEIKHSLS